MRRDCTACFEDEDLRRAWGCESQDEYKLWRGTPYEVSTFGCPAKSLEGWEQRCLDLYFFFRDGKFPIGGGVLDQGAQALEAFGFLDDLFAYLRRVEKR